MSQRNRKKEKQQERSRRKKEKKNFFFAPPLSFAGPLSPLLHARKSMARCKQ
jgi:hypothetical protein